jgi:hypothetical protein
MKESEMGRACRVHGRPKNVIKSLARETELKIPHGGSRLRSEGNRNVDLE